MSSASETGLNATSPDLAAGLSTEVSARNSQAFQTECTNGLTFIGIDIESPSRHNVGIRDVERLEIPGILMMEGFSRRIVDRIWL